MKNSEQSIFMDFYDFYEKSFLQCFEKIKKVLTKN